MFNIIIFGAPGAGKGTQSIYIVEKYHLLHLSTGDIFRRNIREQTELGKTAQTYINQGNLVPDQITIQMLENEIQIQKPEQGILLDGFPRTLNQAERLDTFLAQKNTAIHLVLGIEVPEKELTERLLLRGQVSGRADDANLQVIQDRIREYHQKTSPLRDFYIHKKLYYPIEGTGSIENIRDRIFKCIDELQKKVKK